MSNLGGLPTITNGTCPGRQPDITLVIGPQIFYEYSYELRIWSDYFDTAFRYDNNKTYFEFPHRDPEEWELIKQLTKFWTREPITKENASIALSWFNELCFPEGVQECDTVISEQVIPMLKVKKEETRWTKTVHGRLWGLVSMYQVAMDNNLPKTVQICKDRLMEYSKNIVNPHRYHQDVRLLSGRAIFHRLSKQYYNDKDDDDMKRLDIELQCLKESPSVIQTIKGKILHQKVDPHYAEYFCVEAYLMRIDIDQDGILAISPNVFILDAFVEDDETTVHDHGRRASRQGFQKPYKASSLDDVVPLVTLDFSPYQSITDEMYDNKQIKTRVLPLLSTTTTTEEDDHHGVCGVHQRGDTTTRTKGATQQESKD